MLFFIILFATVSPLQYQFNMTIEPNTYFYYPIECAESFQDKFNGIECVSIKIHALNYTPLNTYILESYDAYKNYISGNAFNATLKCKNRQVCALDKFKSNDYIVIIENIHNYPLKLNICQEDNVRDNSVIGLLIILACGLGILLICGALIYSIISCYLSKHATEKQYIQIRDFGNVQTV